MEKIGVGLISVKFNVTGKISGEVKCINICVCPKMEWTVKSSVSISVPVTVGFGLTIKALNWLWNWPKSGKNITKTVAKGPKAFKYSKIFKNALAAKGPNAICGGSGNLP